jgi:hypothetical protein
METRKKVVVISHDYDGCGDVLFNEVKETFRECDRIPANKCEKKLESYHQEITKDADIVELYVGSLRQDIEDDERNIEEHKNGSCFKNYASLCVKNNWVFREFLLGDVKNNLPAGSTMKDRNIMSFAFFKKSYLIEQQLVDVKNNHPDADIYFYFLDDDSDEKHFKDIKEFIELHPLANNIKKFSLVRFNWVDEVNAHIAYENKRRGYAQSLFSQPLPATEPASRLFEVAYCKEQEENAVVETPDYQITSFKSAA